MAARFTIPTADIEEVVEGKSLMPKGLTTFLTEQESLDLARLVSELGKPGPYADVVGGQWRTTGWAAHCSGPIIGRDKREPHQQSSRANEELCPCT